MKNSITEKKVLTTSFISAMIRIHNQKPRIFNMNLAQALKQKNRLAGELNRQQQILQRENARRSDSVSTVDRNAVLQRIITISVELGELKAKIAKANVGIYHALERMAEFKSQISFFQGLNKQVGEEVSFIGRDNEKLVYKWDSLITQEKCDEMVADLQEKINELQDEVDRYNAITEIQ
jgi:hypothetical protein